MGGITSEHTQSLLKLAKELLSTSEHEQTLDLIVNSALTLLRGERGFLVLMEGQSLTFNVIRNWSINEYEAEQEPISRSIIKSVIEREGPLLIEDASRDGRYRFKESVRRLGIRSVLASPLLINNSPVGVLYLENRSLQNPFQKQDVALFEEILSISSGALRSSVERLILQQQNELLTRDLLSTQRFPGILTRDAGFLRILETAARVATSELPVLLQGASGTGKELIAKAIHLNSKRAKRSFQVINCGAISPLLLESELFGHLRGAFTGALANKDGLIATAHRGTLLLDEVAELPKELQVKLLRTLQFGELQPVGSTQTQIVDVRFIAATNKNLETEVSQGRFREDLFYRLNAMTLFLPPLKDRSGDILLLFHHFLNHTREGQYKLTPAMERCLEEYHWPGNIREIENEAKRLRALYDPGAILSPEMLSPRVWQKSGAPPNAGPLKSLTELEKEAIAQHILAADGNRTRAAETLGVTREGLRLMMRRHGLD
jgi:Nif-specific regulatory protein